MGIDAYYDPNTDKIENCKEYSFSWWHERGHQVFYNKNRERSKWINSVLIDSFYFGVIIALVELTYNGRISTPWPLLAAGAPFFWNMAEEIIAWIFCFAHWKDWK